MKHPYRHYAAKSFSKLSSHLALWHQVIQDQSILDRARNRMVIGILIFAFSYLIVSIRLIDVMLIHSQSDAHHAQEEKQESLILERADILDRNGEVLATHITTASLYANPKVILDPKDAAEKICALFPHLDFDTILARLESQKGFVWLVRHLTPKQQYSVNALGIPGIYLQQDQKRIYPYGIMLSHVLGYCGTDNIGLSGIEKYFDLRLRKDKTPLVLSVDLRLQHVIHEELKNAIQEFSAIAGNAMLVDLDTGEMLAMVSLPDFDPNQPNLNAPESVFNRNTLGVYEPGSVFKVFNTAAALETGRIKLSSVYDASHPIKVGRFTITDFKGQNRPLTVEETFMFSSNIASAKMALDFGGEWQRKYLAQFGLFSKPSLEIPEIGAPIVAKHWTEATTISTAFGYSISVSPLQTLRGVAAVLTRNFRDFTLLHQKTPIIATDIVSEKTSAAIKHLMKLVTTKGTATKANVPGYPVLGKTGSAHKVSGRSYHKHAKVTSLIGVFPESSPKYMLMVMLDAPQPTKNTYGYSTAGWNAAPTGGKIIGRIAPILGLTPDFESSIQQENPVKMVNHYIPD